MEWIFFSSFMFGLLIFVIISCIVGCCVRRRRRGAVLAAPVVVTTATQQVPFTPGPQMQQTNIYPNQSPYAMAPQGYAMPMPATNQSYPMPQPGYAPSGGAPYPPGPHDNMNPPSYDQVVGTTTTTTESYAKQSPYNPSYTG